MSLFAGFIQLGAGLSVGLAGLAAGFAIGIVGDAGVRGTAQQPRLFVGMILILIVRLLALFSSPSLPRSVADDLTLGSQFAEVLGLYGLIVALILNGNVANAPPVRPSSPPRRTEPISDVSSPSQPLSLTVLNAPTSPTAPYPSLQQSASYKRSSSRLGSCLVITLEERQGRVLSLPSLSNPPPPFQPFSSLRTSTPPPFILWPHSLAIKASCP